MRLYNYRTGCSWTATAKKMKKGFKRNFTYI